MQKIVNPANNKNFGCTLTRLGERSALRSPILSNEFPINAFISLRLILKGKNATKNKKPFKHTKSKITYFYKCCRGVFHYVVSDRGLVIHVYNRVAYREHFIDSSIWKRLGLRVCLKCKK